MSYLRNTWYVAAWAKELKMALWAGAVESGKSPETGNESVGAHLFTPETANHLS